MRPAVFRIGVVVCAIASLIGAVQSAIMLVSTLAQASLPEYERRLVWWSGSYGFAISCAAKLAPQARIVLVNPVVGAGEIAPPVLDFDPDASHFAYPLSPAVVTVQWDLSTPWLPLDGEADYVAVWHPMSGRSPAQNAAAVIEEQSLDSRFPSSVVCAYDDPQGDRGTIYAVSSRAARGSSSSDDSPASESLARPYSSVLTTLRVYLGLASLWCIGALIVIALAGARLPMRLLAALALPAGCLAASVELTLFSVLGAPWSVGWLAAPFLVLGVYLLRTHRPWRTPGVSVSAQRCVRAVRQARLRTADWIVVLALLAIGGLLVAVAPLGLPVRDGFSAGYFKAHVFWVDGGVLPFYQTARNLFYAQPTHPPLVALTVDWLYLMAGGVDEHATLVLWPVLLCWTLGTLFALLRSVTTARVAAGATLLAAVSASDLVQASLQYGYADLPLALFLLAGAGVLWLSIVRPQLPWRLQLVGGVLLAGAAWTKEEGIIAGPVAVVLVAVFARRAASDRSGRWWFAPAASAAGYALAILPLLFLRFAFPAPEVIVQAAGLNNALSRLPVVLVGFGLRSIQHWYLPIALVALVVWQLRSGSHARGALRAASVWFLLLVVIAQGGADCAGVAVNTFEVYGELAVAAGRLLTQVSGLVYLAVFTLCIISLEPPDSGVPVY